MKGWQIAGGGVATLSGTVWLSLYADNGVPSVDADMFNFGEARWFCVRSTALHRLNASLQEQYGAIRGILPIGPRIPRAIIAGAPMSQEVD
ncbi:MAG TPA: hypothetical protein VF503_08300 [Sphingobium sp.]|uniref:hypothetical protein n=1 Tax=Sphingobium sp. TaxID=1912891 RepID=UPI002ED6B231